MASAEQRNHAKSYLRKSEEYLAAAEDSLAAERHTPAAGDAIHAGISARDAVVSALTGSTGKGKDHAAAAKGAQAGPGPATRGFEGREVAPRATRREGRR